MSYISVYYHKNIFLNRLQLLIVWSCVLPQSTAITFHTFIGLGILSSWYRYISAWHVTFMSLITIMTSYWDSHRNVPDTMNHVLEHISSVKGDIIQRLRIRRWNGGVQRQKRIELKPATNQTVWVYQIAALDGFDTPPTPVFSMNTLTSQLVSRLKNTIQYKTSTKSLRSSLQLIYHAQQWGLKRWPLSGLRREERMMMCRRKKFVLQKRLLNLEKGNSS